jgi:hypothetical protein
MIRDMDRSLNSRPTARGLSPERIRIEALDIHDRLGIEAASGLVVVVVGQIR